MRQSGFTLLELLVVLSIAAVALALAVPNLPRVGSGIDLTRVERQVAAGLRQARLAAVQSGGVAVFQPDSLSLPPGVQVRSVPAKGVRFHADGSSSGGRIHVGDGSRWRVVEVEWFTGRVWLGG